MRRPAALRGSSATRRTASNGTTTPRTRTRSPPCRPGYDPDTDAERIEIESGLIRRNPYVWGDGRHTEPVTGETAERLEVKVNNLRLSCGGVEEGWLVYPVGSEKAHFQLRITTCHSSVLK